MSRRVEIQVGLTVLVALVVVLWGVTWLKQMSLQNKVTVWHVRFPQTGGLGRSDEVRVNGIRKGEVAAIVLEGDHVVVDLALASDVRLTTDSRVAIRNIGLMGEKVIAVDLATTGARVAPRDTVQGLYELGVPEVVASMGGVFASVERAAVELDRVVTTLQRDGKLEQAVTNLHEATAELRDAVRENRKPLRDAVSDAAVAARTARTLTTERGPQVQRLLDSAERTAAHLEQLSSRLDTLRVRTQSVADKLDHGDGTAAKLVNDRAVYDETRAALKELRELIADIKAHPKKYIHVSVF